MYLYCMHTTKERDGARCKTKNATCPRYSCTSSDLRAMLKECRDGLTVVDGPSCVRNPQLDCWLFSAGQEGNRYPVLGSFLDSWNRAASDASRGEAQSTCADPERWLNPGGHDMLSELPSFGQHNASMLWGTYRPGVYFGKKVRHGSTRRRALLV